MSRRLQDKVAWVTGASSGIGEALAVALAKEGARVVLTARREAELERVRARLPDPDQGRILAADLLDPESIAPAAQAAEAMFGRIDVLVLAAGMSQRALALETDLSTVRRLFELNFFAPVGLTRAVAPGMVRRGEGRVVVVSSVTGYVSTPGRSTYAATKHALHGYYDALRAELHGTGVSVTVLCPGYVRTEISRNALTSDGQPQGTMDAQIAGGMDPAAFARAASDAIVAREREACIGGAEVASIYLKRLLPGVVAWRLPKVRPQ